MPAPGEKIKFKNYHKQMQVPFVIYADFESIINLTKRQLEKNLKSKANTKHAALDIRLLDMMVHHPMLEFTEAKMLGSSS